MDPSTEMKSFIQLSETDMQSIRKDLIKKITPETKESVKSLREAATYLDKVWKDCKIAHASGCSAGSGIVGAGLTIGGGVATILTMGAAAPLLIAGIVIGILGATTNVGTAIAEKAINSCKVKKAENDLKEYHDLLKKELNVIQNMILAYDKDNVENQESSGSVTQDQKISTDIAKSVGVLSKDFVIPAAGIGAGLHELVSQCVKVSAISIGKGSASATGQTAVKAAGIATAEGTGDAVESGAKAGLKAGGCVAAKVTIALSAVVLVVDAVDLGFTIRAIVKNKGSDAGRYLREKADNMEKIILLEQ